MKQIIGNVEQLEIIVGHNMWGGEVYSVKFWVCNTMFSYSTLFKPSFKNGDEVFVLLSSGKVDKNRRSQSLLFISRKSELKKEVHKLFVWQVFLFSIGALLALFATYLGYFMNLWVHAVLVVVCVLLAGILWYRKRKVYVMLSKQ